MHAVVVPADGQRPDGAALHAFCTEHIAGYKAPRSVEFVDALPLSGAGKVLTRELRAPHWAEHDRAVS